MPLSQSVHHAAYPIVSALGFDLLLRLANRCNFWMGVHNGRNCIIIDMARLARNIFNAGHAILFSLSADLCQFKM